MPSPSAGGAAAVEVTDDAGHPAALRVEPPGGDEVGRHHDELVASTGHGEVRAERVGDDGPVRRLGLRPGPDVEVRAVRTRR